MVDREVKATPVPMKSSKLQLPVAIAILLPFFSLPGIIDGQNYLCYDQDGTFTSNETYGTTLDALLRSITTMSSGTLTYGLFNASASWPQYPDDIQVLGVCSGDVTRDECQNCLNETAHQVRQLCPTKKQATLFEDKCWIRYSNGQLFGVVKMDPYITAWDSREASNWDQFGAVLKKLLDGLRDEAASGGPIRKYATGISSVDLSTLYGMVQCTPDLSDQQCNDCLVEIIARLPRGKVGGRVLSPSCRSRFEKYRFFNKVVVPLPSPPPPPLPPPPPPPPLPHLPPLPPMITVICTLVFVIIKRKIRPRDRTKTDVTGVDFVVTESLHFDRDLIRAATDSEAPGGSSGIERV